MAECGENAPVAPERTAAIGAVRPELAGRPIRIHDDGWDCLAVEVDGAFIFKFPLHAEAAERLRREPIALDLVRPATRLEVPLMRLHERPLVMSEHRKIEGVTVDAARYARLSEPARGRLALDLATFFADMHAIPPALVTRSGCDALRPWRTADDLLAGLCGKVSPEAFGAARVALRAHARHGPDEAVFGQFDTHGWNMAYDPQAERLVGLFDFAGAGVGPLHRDLSYLLFVSADLTRRVVGAYRAATGRAVDVDRVFDAHGALRAIELCDEVAAGRAGAPFIAALDAFLCERRAA